MQLTRHLYILVGVYYEEIFREKKYCFFCPAVWH